MFDSDKFEDSWEKICKILKLNPEPRLQSNRSGKDYKKIQPKQSNKNNIKSHAKSSIYVYLTRIISLLMFEREIDLVKDCNVIVQASERYKKQTELLLAVSKNPSSFFVLQWDSYKIKDNKFKVVLLFDFFKYIINIIQIYVSLLFYSFVKSSKSPLVKCYYKAFNKNVADHKTLLNIALLFNLSKNLNRKKKGNLNIFFQGTVDVMSRTISIAFKNKAKLIFIRQNFQCATVEPAFSDFDEIIVPDNVSEIIFSKFSLKTTLIQFEEGLL